MLSEFAFNQPDFEVKVAYMYNCSRFLTHAPMAVFSCVRIFHLMLGALNIHNLLQQNLPVVNSPFSTDEITHAHTACTRPKPEVSSY